MKTTRKNPYKKYRLGNALRGHYVFKARSVKEAWAKGCKLFNEGFPSDNGRSVILEVNDETKITLTTPWEIAQNKLPPEKRYFDNHKEFITIGFIPVAYGISKEQLVF